VSLRKIFIASVFASLGFAATENALSQAVNAGGTYTQRPIPVVERNNLYCAGYVQNSPMNTAMQLVGGLEEQEQYVYSQNNFVYLSLPASGRLNVGDLMSVVRPRGKVKSKWSKKGKLGYYVQEVGAVEIVRVKADHAVARIKTSCDNFLLGDIVQPIPSRVSPLFQERPALDRFADASGKNVGRLIMARDSKEVIAREDIVYIDLGAEDNVQVGDYVTVFRSLGKGGLMMPNESEHTLASSYGYNSDEYKGDKFSNQAPRREGDNAGGRPISQKEAKSGRPSNLRKVVGELVVINVKERTATAVVVRTGQEIHTGDWVEIQ